MVLLVTARLVRNLFGDIVQISFFFFLNFAMPPQNPPELYLHDIFKVLFEGRVMF